MLQFFANIPYPWNYFSISRIPITFSSNIPYPGNFFPQLSRIPKTPNGASKRHKVSFIGLYIFKIRARTVLKINWPVKTPWQSAWKLLAPGYGLLTAVRKTRWGCAAWFSKPLPNFRPPKNVIFHIRFQSFPLKSIFNFERKDQLTEKKDRIIIKNLISNKRKYKTKVGRLILQSGKYISLPIFRKHGLPSSGSYIQW